MKNIGSYNRIVIKFQIEGTHRWAGCDIEEVKYLSNVHRHIFHITARKSVSHDDRDIEIINFKHALLSYLHKEYGEVSCDFGNKSCEMIANELLSEFNLDYCEVLEDGENGAEAIKVESELF